MVKMLLFVLSISWHFSWNIDNFQPSTILSSIETIIDFLNKIDQIKERNIIVSDY